VSLRSLARILISNLLSSEINKNISYLFFPIFYGGGKKENECPQHVRHLMCRGEQDKVGSKLQKAINTKRHSLDITLWRTGGILIVISIIYLASTVCLRFYSVLYFILILRGNYYHLHLAKEEAMFEI
jgi:hypothetical protein